MKTAYKYKLRPTVKQQHQFLQSFGCARFIYNWGLDCKITAYKEDKTSLSYVDLAKEMTQLKKTEEHKWLNDVSNECLQQSLRNLDSAYAKFFRDKKGFPRFKSKKNSTDSVKFINSVRFDFENWKVKVPKCGWIKLCKNRTFNLSYKLGTLTVTRDKCGDYWCTIIVEDGMETRPKAKVLPETSVGIDVGIKDFAVFSDGTKIANPKFYERSMKHLAVLQRKFARKQKGSKRREAARIKVARQQRRICNQRSDFQHKLSSQIIIRHDTVCLEDLNIMGMMQNHHLAKSIQSASWNEFVRMLEYKADRYGKNVIRIGRYEPSSKTCSCCGYVKSDLQLNEREWTCPHCGARHDRDVNAAINIRQFALRNNGPQVSGLPNVEGSDTGLPMKRQDSKSERRLRH